MFQKFQGGIEGSIVPIPVLVPRNLAVKNAYKRRELLHFSQANNKLALEPLRPIVHH